jgi:hypothetical protein
MQSRLLIRDTSHAHTSTFQRFAAGMSFLALARNISQLWNEIKKFGRKSRHDPSTTHAVTILTQSNCSHTYLDKREREWFKRGNIEWVVMSIRTIVLKTHSDVSSQGPSAIERSRSPYLRRESQPTRPTQHFPAKLLHVRVEHHHIRKQSMVGCT